MVNKTIKPVTVQKAKERLARFRGVYTEEGDASWEQQVQNYKLDPRIQEQINLDKRWLKAEDNVFDLRSGTKGANSSASHMRYWGLVQDACQEMGHHEIADFVSTWGKLLQAETGKNANTLTPALIKKTCLRAQLITKIDPCFLGAGKDFLTTAWARGLDVASMLGEKEKCRLFRTVQTDRVKAYCDSYSERRHNPDPVTEASYVLTDILPCIPLITQFGNLVNKGKETLLRFIPILEPLMTAKVSSKKKDENDVWKTNVLQACVGACERINKLRQNAREGE